MDASTLAPWLWAQATPPSASGPGSGPAPLSTLMLGLRRWYGSLTLSPPSSPTGPFSIGLGVWLGALAALLVVAMVRQGPGGAIGQLFDVAGHGRLMASAMARVRRSGRFLGLAVGVSVVAWTSNQTLSYAVATGRDDLTLVTKGLRLSDVALAQGALAALTPLRDVVGLGLMIPLLVGASVVLFQYSTDRWGTALRPPWSIRRRSSRWATVGWGATALYALYRFVALVTGTGEQPMGGCLVVEALVVPTLMALADGVLVAWALVELRNAALGDAEGEALDARSVTLAIPAAALGCLLAFPGRYVAAAVALAAPYVAPFVAPGGTLESYIRWQLGWGLVAFQGVGLLFVGLLGASAWSRGEPWDAMKGYGRMLGAEGGRLVAALGVSGLAAGALSALAYLLVLSLPASTWGLAAADSYAHYGTIPVGLVLLAALVELGERSLPTAMPAGAEGEAPRGASA